MGIAPLKLFQPNPIRELLTRKTFQPNPTWELPGNYFIQFPNGNYPRIYFDKFIAGQLI